MKLFSRNIRMVQCCYCSKKFKYESEKNRHEKSHDPQFECDKCSKKFSFLSALKRHQKQHERTGSVKCPDCGKYFLDDVLLKRHMKYAHKGTYICSKCNAKFSSDVALLSHQKSHKPRSERRFKCSYGGCSKSFNHVHHLKHHELSHSDVKQHYCNICGKGFIQFHHLKSHVKAHSPDTWLSCTVPGCHKSFPDEYGRKRHLLNHKEIVSSLTSDSNSNFPQETENLDQRDEILCSSCGDLVKLSSYVNHTERCKTRAESELCVDVKYLSLNNNNNKQIEFNNSILDAFNESKEYESFQDNTRSSEFYDSMVEKFDTFKGNKELREANNIPSCEGCDCKDNCASTNNNIPQIEYRSNGVIKLKDTLEPDIADICRNNNDDIYVNDVPYNSCKSILGKCIVSGNGTISEECLCAKMALSERDVMEQEIDEITPHPIMSTG